VLRWHPAPGGSASSLAAVRDICNLSHGDEVAAV